MKFTRNIKSICSYTILRININVNISLVKVGFFRNDLHVKFYAKKNFLSVQEMISKPHFGYSETKISLNSLLIYLKDWKVECMEVNAYHSIC